MPARFRAPVVVVSLGLFAAACAPDPGISVDRTRPSEAAERPSSLAAVQRELRARNAGTPEELDAQTKGIVAAAATFDEVANGLAVADATTCVSRCERKIVKCNALCAGLGAIAFAVGAGVCAREGAECQDACSPATPPAPSSGRPSPFPR